jgi:threonine dehydrogenase-like Zn-dependent dehydrogenase
MSASRSASNSISSMFFAYDHLHGGHARPRRYLLALTKLVGERKTDLGKVFDLTVALERVAQGYPAMGQRRAIKTLLPP